MDLQNNLTKSKAFAARTIMNDKKLARTINDAINAPAGSLKKSKAKAILQSFSRAHQNYLASKMTVEDGKGGVGLPASTGFSMNTPLAKYAPTGFSLFPYKNTTGGMSSANAPMSTMETPTPSATAVKSPTPMTKVEYTVPKVPTISPAPTIKIPEIDDYNVLNNIKSNFGDSYLEKWVNALSTEEKKRLSPVIESVRLGEGSDTFTQRMLNDKKQLATLLNTPIEIVQQFPTGTISEQLNKIQESVNKKYQLDEQLKNLNNLINQNITAKDDITTYIRTKDDYLSSINKLIDDFEYKTAFQDTSDPSTQQKKSNYLTYLNLLKNKTESRYVNYLNSAINVQNNKLQQKQNLYNTTLKQAESEYNKQATVTKETYTIVSNMLKNLYENISDRGDDLRDLETYELNRLKSLQNLAENQEDNYNKITYTYDNIKSMLENSKGIDGYVNTEKYKQLREKSENKSDFDKNFAYMLSPADPSARAISTAEPKFLTAEYFKNAFKNSTIASMLTAMGKTRKEYSTWKESKAKEEENIRNDYNKWIETELIKIIEEYRKVGYSDKEILKMMPKE